MGYRTAGRVLGIPGSTSLLDSGCPEFLWRGRGDALGKRQPLSARLIAVLSWGVIGYGGALSALLAVLFALAAQERAPAVLVVAAAGAFAGPVAWNAILRATAANQFFVDAPIRVFPISWQDTGSGVFALAALAFVLGAGPLRTGSGGRLALLSVLGGLAALIVDIYLY
jgi:hypothetical protein